MIEIAAALFYAMTGIVIAHMSVYVADMDYVAWWRSGLIALLWPLVIVAGFICIIMDISRCYRG